MSFSDAFSTAVNAVMNNGLKVSAYIGSAPLSSIFFGSTNYATNSAALAIAADRKNYDVTGMMLKKSAGRIFGRYDFALGESWDRFEEAAKKDPVLERQYISYNWKSEQAINKIIPYTL